MSLFATLALYGSLFLGVLLAVDAAFGLARSPGSSNDPAVRRRLDAVRRIVTDKDGEGYSIRRDLGDVPPWGRYVPFYGYLSKLVRESGDQVTVARLLIIMGALSLAIFIALSVAASGIVFPLRVILALLLGIAPIVLSVKTGRDKRRKKFEEQLPDALDLIVRSLRVGHPLSGAIKVVADELPDPIGSEFRVAFEQITYGDEIPQAFLKMAERMPAPDLSYLTVAIQIHHESGGNLAEILSKLSAVIRDRFRMFRKVKAITAEARFSAWFLSGFPVAIIFFIQLVKPDYYAQVADFAYFPHLVAMTFILLLVNVVAMKVMTAIKV